MKEITREPGSTWMLQEVPRGQTDVYFEMLATGESRWRFGQSGVEGVVEALPEFRPSLQDTLPAAPTTGPARVDVTVMDRFDTPLEGATVKLTGVVGRESNSDAAGAVRFESLPEGRYDVVASAKGLSSSVTRVLDLSSSRGTIVISGIASIYGSEEGVFRIRNGRVEPLGSGGAASEWKGGSAVEFFAHLQTTRTVR